MRKVLIALAASAALATPALANEARIEARGGVVWSDGVSEDVWGVAAGYDFDLGESTFAGLEVSGDKIGVSDSKVSWGLGARVGAKVANDGKLYAIGAYNTENCSDCGDESFSVGAGYQQGLGKNVYLKAEYRHFFFDDGLPDANAVIGGVGVKF